MQRNDIIVEQLTLIEIIGMGQRMRVGSSSRVSKSLMERLNFQETRQKDEHRGSFARQILRMIPTGHTIFIVKALDQFHSQIDGFARKTRFVQLQLGQLKRKSLKQEFVSSVHRPNRSFERVRDTCPGRGKGDRQDGIRRPERFVRVELDGNSWPVERFRWLPT